MKEEKEEVEKSNLKYIWIVLAFVLFLGILAFNLSNKEEPTCGDGTAYGFCSEIQPYYCEEGILVEKASICGCGNLVLSGNSCVSELQTNPKQIELPYILRGEKNSLSFTVYQGIYDYVSRISRSIVYGENETPSRADFKLKSIDEKEQRKLLLPLVIKIQNLTNNKKDQVRIAVSLVQSIPYGFSNKTTSLFGQEINYSRYPYEVLYEGEGICGEKSALLSFILREMDYGVVFFYHSQENHESIGIKCLEKESLGGTGYCFIETTGPSIITDSGIEYVGGITLESQPEVILISEGNSIGKRWYEYGDAELLNKLREGRVLLFPKTRLNKLKEKYGLIEEYYLD